MRGKAVRAVVWDGDVGVDGRVGKGDDGVGLGADYGDGEGSEVDCMVAWCVVDGDVVGWGGRRVGGGGGGDVGSEGGL